VDARNGSNRVVIAWEVGGHLGHLHRCAAVARIVREAGRDPVVVARDTTRTREVEGLRDVPVLQAPLPERVQRTWRPPPASLADVLYMSGFRDPRRLRGRIDAWRATFDLVDASLVIAEYAPSAVLAARLDGRRVFAMGHGFTLPPRESPLRPFASASPRERQRVDRVEQQVLDRIRRAVGDVPNVPGNLVDLLRTPDDVLATVAELDPFPDRDGDEYAGPLLLETRGIDPQWSESGPRVFAYLKASEPHARLLFNALHTSGCSARVFCPDAGREMMEKCRGSPIVLSRSPFALAPVLAGADTAICHGGHDTLYAALHAGCPVGVLPTQTEQLETAQRVAAFGGGDWGGPKSTQPQCDALLDHVLHSEKPRRHAAAFRAKYRHLRADGRMRELIDS